MRHRLLRGAADDFVDILILRLRGGDTSTQLRQSPQEILAPLYRVKAVTEPYKSKLLLAVGDVEFLVLSFLILVIENSLLPSFQVEHGLHQEAVWNNKRVVHNIAVLCIVFYAP